jgi:hypothetical protein
MEEKVGRGRRFRSYREWSIRAGLNPNRASQVAEQGTANWETLVALGRAAGKSPREMFTLAGWLPPEELAPGLLSPEEQELLESLRRLRESQPALYEATAEYVRRVAERVEPSNRYSV